MISVIIPNYKRIKSLVRSIESVLNQTINEQIEIIVVDDNSPNFEKINDELLSLVINKNCKLIIIKHEINKNAAAARNTGILYATGKYLALLDSDDEWNKNYLQNQINTLNDQDGVFVYGVVKNVTCLGSWVKPNFPLKETQRVDEYIFLLCQSIQTSSIFSKKINFENNLFDENLKAFQDYSFCINAQSNGLKFLYSPKSHVTRYVEYNEENDHVGRKIENEFLKQWRSIHLEQMTQLSLDSYNIRFAHFFCNGLIKKIAFILKHSSFRTRNLAMKSIIKIILGSLKQKAFFIKFINTFK